MAEDLAQLRLDVQPVSQLAEAAERELVVDLIVDPGPPVHRGEPMPVHPAAVWTPYLDVGEAVWRVVRLDARSPAHRDRRQWPNAMVDLEPWAHREIRGQLLEAHRRRRDPA